ncbi:hypothetical protein B0H16DRAFT_1729330 [Mycena metata]|uniref:C2H2-type domain-containing protein n=1 Tax=Mycena metata TaxID=1033252 RepID=A0AAD7IBQ4_9AGAR|nr:hypothetical protein B0H16DRAFT_1729330 [Mycena metata]
MYACPDPGCLHKTFQRSNLITHYRTHTHEKPNICPDCLFATGDPATLTLHRKSRHGYVPRLDQTQGRTVL